MSVQLLKEQKEYYVTTKPEAVELVRSTEDVMSYTIRTTERKGEIFYVVKIITQYNTIKDILDNAI